MNDSLYESAKDQINVGIISHIYPPGGKGIQSRREIINLLRGESYATFTFIDEGGRQLYTWVCNLDDVPALESWVKAEGFSEPDVVRIDINRCDRRRMSHSALIKKKKTVFDWVRE